MPLGGVVTFMFTDMEGSTRLLQTLGRERYAILFGEHQRLLREAFAAAGGYEVETQGDSFFVAFGTATDAIAAAVAGQRSLAVHDWVDGVAPTVRMGVHTGEAKSENGHYVGVAVHSAARISAAAHGGQVLVSAATRELLGDEQTDPRTFALRDKGLHRLKDFDRPVRLYQLVAEGLQERFPPLRTADGHWRHRFARHRGALAAFSLAVVVGAATAGALLLTGSARAKPVDLAGDSVAIFDARTGHPVADILLSDAPGNVVAGGDQVWVLNRLGQTVTAIAPTSLRVLQTIGLDGQPTVQWAVGPADYIGLPDQSAIDTVGLASLAGPTKISLWKAPTSGNAYLMCGLWITGGAGKLWVSQGRHFAVLDATSGGILRDTVLPPVPGIAPAAACGYAVVGYVRGRLFAVRDQSNSVGTLDPASWNYTPILTPKNARS